MDQLLSMRSKATMTFLVDQDAEHALLMLKSNTLTEALTTENTMATITGFPEGHPLLTRSLATTSSSLTSKRN
jgi:hypothetical protein